MKNKGTAKKLITLKVRQKYIHIYFKKNSWEYGLYNSQRHKN